METLRNSKYTNTNIISCTRKLLLTSFNW